MFKKALSIFLILIMTLSLQSFSTARAAEMPNTIQKDESIYKEASAQLQQNYNINNEYSHPKYTNPNESKEKVYPDIIEQNETLSTENIYYKDNGSISTFSILNGVDISINKTIVEEGKDSSVIISVTSNGQPIVNEMVDIVGLASGLTDSLGKFSAIIHPNYSGMINIHFRGVDHPNLLYSLRKEQAVLEVYGLDRSGVNIYDFEIEAISQNSISRSSTNNGVIRTIVDAGQNSIILSHVGDGLTEAYYMLRNTMVAPFQLNQVTLLGAETIPANLTFKYGGANIPSGEVFVRNESILSDSIKFPANKYIGNTNSTGAAVLNITPGIYSVYIKGIVNSVEACYLKSSNQEIVPGASDINFAWDASNTGTLHLNNLGNIPSNAKASFAFNDCIVDMPLDGNVRMAQGGYSLEWIMQGYELNSQYYNYEYRKPGDSEIIIISSSIPASYTFNSDFVEANVSTYPNTIMVNEQVEIVLNFITQSGHNLINLHSSNEAENLRQVDYTMTKPDGSTAYFKSHDFKYTRYFIEGDQAVGNYTLSTTKNFGPLYGAKHAEGSFSVMPTPVITTDKSIIKCEEETSVTLTILSNNQPLVGAQVNFDGYDIQGTTNANGQFTTTFTPHGSGEIGIIVDGRYYGGKLFSLRDNEGAVQVTAKDKNSNPIRNFNVEISSPNSNWVRDTQGEVAWVIGTQGTNTIMLTHIGEEGYYIIKDINILPGQLNIVELSGIETVNVALSFSYGNEQIKYGTVSLKNTGFNNDNIGWNVLRPAGLINTSDVAGLNVTPGIYKLGVETFNKAGERMYLYKEDQLFNSNLLESYSWAPEQTGLVNFNINPGIINTQGINIRLNDHVLDLQNNRTIRMNEGSYEVPGISLNGRIGEEYVYYEFNRPNEIVSIQPNMPFNYDFDASFNSSYMFISPTVAKRDETVGISTSIITNSGHELAFTSRNSQVEFLLTDPNNNKRSIFGYFRGFSWYIEKNAPSGRYTIDTTLDFGPLYPIQQLSGEFQVASDPVLSLDKNCLMINEPTQVTITATLDGMPLADKPISFRSYSQDFGSYTTDSEGKFVLDITPNSCGPIIINIDGKEYKDQLFVVDNYLGIIEITAKGKSGNTLENFHVNVSSTNNGSSFDANGNVGRIDYPAGPAQIILTCENEEGSYFITKNINILPGVINKIEVSALDTVLATMQFQFDGSPIKFANINLRKQGSNNSNYYNWVGSTNDLGNKNIYVSPGLYSCAVSTNPDMGQLLFLEKYDINIDSDANYLNSWQISDTAVAQFNIIGFEGLNTNIGFVLNGAYVDLRNTNSIRMSTNTISLDRIELDMKGVDIHQHYAYQMPWGQQYLIPIVPEGSTTNNNFNIDLSMSSVTIWKNKSNFTPGEFLDFGVKATTVSGFELDYVQDQNGMNVIITKPDDSSDVLNPGDFKWANYQLPMDAIKGTYKMHIYVNLGVGYWQYELYDEFVVGDPDGPVGPILLGTTPTDGQHEVAIGSNIVEEFNCDIFQSDNFNNIKLSDAAGNIIPITCRIEGKNLIIDPVNDLEYGKLYNALVPRGSVADATGEKLVWGWIFGFITQEEVVPFQLKVTNPETNVTNVPVKKKLEITYSEDIMPGTNFNTIELKTSDGSKIKATIEIDNRSIVITPEHDLAYATNYVVVIPENAVTNMSGTSGNEVYSLQFTTEADNLAPIIISSNPLDNSIGFGVGNEISINFDDAINFVVNTTQVGNKKGEKAGTIELRDSLGNIVMVKASIVGNTLSIMPLSPMNYNTQYTLVIPKNFISDKVGNRNLNEYILNFTTGNVLPN